MVKFYTSSGSDATIARIPIDTTGQFNKWISPATLLAQMEKIVADKDQYSDDEARPSAEVLECAKQLINGAADSIPTYPPTHITVFYGELDFTWRKDNRLLKLVIQSNGNALLYFQTDDGKALTRGESIPANSAALAERIKWLST